MTATTLESLLERRRSLIFERAKLSRGIFSPLFPSIRLKQGLIDQELDRVAEEIYNLVNPQKPKDDIDSLLERADECFKQGMSLLTDGNQSTQV